MKTEIYSATSFLPKKIVHSKDIFEEIKSDTQYGIPTNWMSDDMGVQERRVIEKGTKPSELAFSAAEKAILKSGLSSCEIDMVLFCGIERDQPEPATAHTISNMLNINAKRTFDVSNACFGFIDGLEIANSYISSNKIKSALIVTSETFSDPVDRLISQLKEGVTPTIAKKNIGFLSLGDAGGAVVVGRSRNGTSGFEGFNTHTLSDEVLRCHYKVSKRKGFIGQMQMAHLSALMIKGHTQILEESLKKFGWHNFNWLLSHQIGKRPFERLMKLNKISEDRMIKSYDFLGNIASATFPVNFDMLLKNDNLKQGSKIGGMFAGSGLVYGQIGYTI